MEWREVERQQIADCRIFTVERSTAVSPMDGSRHEFFRLQSVDWVQVLPITSDGQAVLVRQYRHGTQELTLEIPSGLMEPGEEPAAAALRECFEETGYRGAVTGSLGVLRPNPAFMSNRLHSFFAEGVKLVGSVQNTDREQTQPVLVPLAELPGLLRSGAIDHALVAAPLWRYLHDHARHVLASR